MKLFITFLLAITAISTNLNAQSHIWKVSKNGNTIYIGGTIHALRPTDFPLPEAYEKAFEKSEIIVFETDIEGFQNPEIASKMMAKAVYTEGNNLEKVLQPETFEQLKKLCEASNIPLDMIINFKPFMAVMLISMQKMTQMGFQPGGIDQFYFDKTKKENKAQLFFETPEEQINYLVTTGKGDEDAMVKKSCEDLSKFDSYMEELIEAWKIGNIDFLTSEVVRTQKEYPSIYNTLLAERNNKWMTTIPNYFKTKEVEFILVGAMHLYGEEGLLKQLKKEGYLVEVVQ